MTDYDSDPILSRLLAIRDHVDEAAVQRGLPLSLVRAGDVLTQMALHRAEEIDGGTPT